MRNMTVQDVLFSGSSKKKNWNSKNVLTSVSSSFNLVNRSSFPLVGKYLASADMYGTTVTATANPMRNKTENLPAAIAYIGEKIQFRNRRRFIKNEFDRVYGGNSRRCKVSGFRLIINCTYKTFQKVKLMSRL